MTNSYNIFKILNLKSGKRKRNTGLRTKPDETAAHQYMPRGPNMKSFLPIVTTIAFDHTEYSHYLINELDA